MKKLTFAKKNIPVRRLRVMMIVIFTVSYLSFSVFLDYFIFGCTFAPVIIIVDVQYSKRIILVKF